MNAHREVRRKDKFMGAEESIEFLRRASVGRLGTLGSDGFPYVIPMSFAYRDGKIYLHSARQGQKLDDIRQSPRVCFEVDEDLGLNRAGRVCDWAQYYRSAIVFGTARILEDSQDAVPALQALVDKYSAMRGDDVPGITAFSPEGIRKVAVVEITVERITGKKGLPKA